MPKYIIERDLPGAGNLSPQELRDISRKSVGILHDMNRRGIDVQWRESYVAGDKIYCVYNAPSEDVIREHARCGGFPANRIELVRTVIDPTTAE